jgi:molecular chaperone GrpE
MDDKSRTPRGAGAEPVPTGAGTPTPGADRSPGRDEIDEPPEVNRWEDEGGIVEETTDAPVAVPEEAGPDYKDRWLRAEADLQNFRRRASREWEEGRRAAEEDVLLECVTALDDLERALEAARSSGATGAWIEGVTLVAQRLRDGLARRGVTVEDPMGRPFDPAFHEALLEVDAPEGVAPGTVVQVAHKGYRRGERALRAARVVVARTPAGSPS